LPPPFYLYETFNLNYDSFFNKSIDTAEWLVSYFKKYKTLNGLKILDWGCGPGRVVRHLPLLINNDCQFYGTDYNKKYIDWCKKNIPDVCFSLNELQPPLKFENNTFEIIYGISVFTHLSEKMHFLWFDELLRILKPGGILFITLQGDAFTNKLTDNEKFRYDKGDLVVKSNTKEGHRTYASFHPSLFVERLIQKNKILEHKPGSVKNNKPEQDIWIVKKCKG